MMRHRAFRGTQEIDSELKTGQAESPNQGKLQKKAPGGGQARLQQLCKSCRAKDGWQKGGGETQGGENRQSPRTTLGGGTLIGIVVLIMSERAKV